MPTVLDAGLRPCRAVSRASILSNQICSSCSTASVSRSKVRPAVCSGARDTFDYAGLCACAAGSRVLLTPFQPHVLGLVQNGICVLSVFRCQSRAAGARGATRCSSPTRNDPQCRQRAAHHPKLCAGAAVTRQRAHVMSDMHQELLSSVNHSAIGVSFVRSVCCVWAWHIAAPWIA